MTDDENTPSLTEFEKQWSILNAEQKLHWESCRTLGTFPNGVIEILPVIPGHSHVIGAGGLPTCGCSINRDRKP